MGLADEIKDKADLLDVIARAGVALKRKGPRLVGLCPFHSEASGSFTVFDQNSPPSFHCFGCGAHGTVIDFVMKSRDLDLTGALRELASELNIAGEAPDPHREAKEKERRAALRARHRADEERRRAWKRAGAAEIYRAATHRPDAVRPYLAIARGINLDAIARMWPESAPDGVPLTLRFHPHCPDFEHDRVDPAMIGMIVAGGDAPSFAGIHRTFLTRDWTDKRGFSAKMMLGDAWRGCVRLTAPGRLLVLSEGIETGLSVMAALAKRGSASDSRTADASSRAGVGVFAALSLDNIAGRGFGEMPDLTDAGIALPSVVREVLIAEDADNKDPEKAGRLYARAARRFGRRGLLVGRCRPQPGMDFNDMLRMAA